MKMFKLKINAAILVILLVLMSGCTMFSNSNDNGVKYEGGFFIVTLNDKFEKVYDATIEAIKTGQTYDANNSTYDLRINKKTDNKAVIGAIGSNASDFVEVVMAKTSDDTTKISVKYGKEGDTIRSSALVGIIKYNIDRSK